MKNLAIFLGAILCSFLYGDDVHISPRFQTVYIREMTNAFDQHLASRLTSARVLWVVLDPAKADAVLTDAIDDNFLNWVQRTYTKPTPGATETSAPVVRRPPSLGEESLGTVFLVDPRSRLVLWSGCERPKDSSIAEADRTAIRLTNELKVAFGKK